MTSNQISYKKCHHCEGKGYIEIRDCSAEVQREETCSFCRGTGEIEIITPTQKPGFLRQPLPPNQH